jgi:hypothetical protein
MPTPGRSQPLTFLPHTDCAASGNIPPLVPWIDRRPHRHTADTQRSATAGVDIGGGRAAAFRPAAGLADRRPRGHTADTQRAATAGVDTGGSRTSGPRFGSRAGRN